MASEFQKLWYMYKEKFKKKRKEKGNKRKKKNATNKKYKQLVRSSIFSGYISYTDFINYASKYGSFNFLDYIRQFRIQNIH